MPELNPLSNEQIFLKKIAENTGSDYNTGDVSEINPLTIDQILLKEIAANTAGQSGDITELEEKVTANTGAIEAIVNEYGAKNLLPVTLSNLKANNTDGTWSGSTYTYRDVTFTCTTSGDIVTSITMNGTANSDGDSLISIPMACHAGKWLANGGTADSSSSTFGAFVYVSSSVYPYVSDEDVEINLNSDATISYIIYTRTGQTCSNVTFYPMIRDARITDPTYVPYAMTNGELTERVINKNVSLCSPTTVTTGDTVTVDNLDKYKEIIVVFTTNNNDGYRKTTMAIPKSVINYSAEGQVWENFYLSIFDSPSYYSSLICNFTNSTTLKILHAGTAGWTINNYAVQVFGSM